MEHPPPELSRARLERALITMLDAAMPACAHIPYRLVGTAAAVLHGVDLPAADVDILVKRRGDVDAFGAALASFRCLSAPAWLPGARQYYASYDVAGANVEFSTVEVESDADSSETIGRGPWERYVTVPCGPHVVPTVALELRLVTELVRDRRDRYGPIIGAMRAGGYDPAFLRRAMAAVGLSEVVRERVLGQLEGAPRGGPPGGEPLRLP